MTYDPYTIVRTGIADATRGLDTLGRGGLALAQQDNERAYNKSLIDDMRAYNDATYKSRLNEERAHTESERLKEAQRINAGLGGTLSTSTDINAIARENAQLEQQKNLDYSAAEARQKTKLEIERVNALDDAKLDREAQYLGYKGDPNDRKAKADFVTKASLEQNAKMQQAIEAINIQYGLQSPTYQALAPQVAALNLAIDKEMNGSVLAPALSLSLQDRMSIGNTIVDNNASFLSTLPDGANRIKALRDGDIAKAIVGLEKVATPASASGMSASGAGLAANAGEALGNMWLQQTQQLSAQNYSVGVQTYLKQLQTSADKLKVLMDARDRLYKSAGPQAGAALMATKTQLTLDHAAPPPGPMPGVQNPGASNRLPPPAATGMVNPGLVSGAPTPTPGMGNQLQQLPQIPQVVFPVSTTPAATPPPGGTPNWFYAGPNPLPTNANQFGGWTADSETRNLIVPPSQFFKGNQ